MAIEKAKNGLTHLGAGTYFEGKIEVPHDLALYGSFSGEVNCKGEVTIGKKGDIKAKIKAQSAIVDGRLEGTLECSGTVELEGNAILVGNITAKELIINKGAKFQGNSAMGEKPVAEPVQELEPDL